MSRSVQAPKFDEEARVLLRKIIEGQAYRQLMLANIRGHGLKFVPDVEGKLALSRALEVSLVQFREVGRLYANLGFGDVVSAVRGKMERIPYPGARLELAMCLYLCERVSWHALGAYVDSVSKEFAAIARTRLEEFQPRELPDDSAFVEFCADATNRPHAQQLFNRWLAITLVSLGRPGSAGDARAIALGLRQKSAAQIAREYLAGLEPLLAACGLAMPAPATLGVELPAAAKSGAR
jgi:1,2-phenylacetyl-CoA epoxidase catalytic subunit